MSSDLKSESVPNNKKAKTVNNVQQSVREVPNRDSVVKIENLSHGGHSLEKEAKDKAIYMKVGLQEEAMNVKNEPQEEFMTIKKEIDEEVDEMEEVPQDIGQEVVKVNNDVLYVLHSYCSQPYVVYPEGFILCF